MNKTNSTKSIERLRQKRREENLCIVCGGKKDREGYHCTVCKDKYNKLKYRYILKLYGMGICTNCSQERDRLGWFCSECCKYLRDRARTRSAERRANSQCVQCGAKVNSGSYCRRCLDMLAERRRRKKEKEVDTY